MRHARAYALAGFATLVVGAVAFAQTTVEPLPDNPPVETTPLDANAVASLSEARPGDAQKGASLAGTCAACHGLDGKGTIPDIYPNIAGQSERYIAHQLALFKSGERQNAIMQPFAAMLTAQDMRDLGAHFATQVQVAGIADDTVVADGQYKDMKFYEIGQQLFRSGDATRDLPACMACHGPAGHGNPGPAYPAVAGQQSWYTARRLQEYRAGTTGEQDKRLFDVMAAVAKSLTDEEIQSLASYMQGLHARPDAKTLAAIDAAKATAPAPAPAAAPAVETPIESAEPAADAAATPAQGS